MTLGQKKRRPALRTWCAVGIAIPDPFFSIPGFGIEKFLIPESRDPGGITQMAVILANSTKVDKTKSAAGPDK